MENLLDLQKIIFLQLRDPKYFDEICLQKKFTFSQKVTLRKYLTQWQARFPLRNPLDEIRQRMTASQILKDWLDDSNKQDQSSNESNNKEKDEENS